MTDYHPNMASELDPRDVSLTELLARATDEKWCVVWSCTTCGGLALRNGLSEMCDTIGPNRMARELAAQADFIGGSAETFVLRWLDTRVPLSQLLAGSDAGLFMTQMVSSKAGVTARRREHAARNDPAHIQAERDRKKAFKAEQHALRSKLKADRSPSNH
jgi:hypothetical protein